MATSSEDVLLQMGEIRYKKGDGTLYVMSERLAWMAEHRDTVAVSHRYADIKMQKISPEGKPKVQLQVVLHDGNSSTFHFVNRNGLKAQLEDRDKVKELLQQLLPNFKRKVDKELEEKNRILAEHPNLFQMYKDLVITQVITSEEFWERHAKEFAMKKVTPKQEIGVSGAFLADIKPQTDGCNGLKYNLSADTIHCIFKTYPAVKKKHQENVPGKMTEAEFWTKFFQSHYFHRDRITAGTKDIFTECGKIDDQIIKAAVQQGPDNPLLDLKRFEDVTLEEGFGTADGAANETVNSGNIVHQNLIKRFNQHSIMVLNSCTGSLNSTSAAAGPLGGKDKLDGNASNGLNKHRSDENTETAEDIETKRKKLVEKIRYEDLGEPPVEGDESEKSKYENLNIQFEKVDAYFHGPTSSSTFENLDNLPPVSEVQQALIKITETWTQRTSHKSLVSSTAAVNALGELSPGGALMRGFQEQSTGQLVPPEWDKEVRNLYIVLNELLKHFWKSFPLTSPEAEDKARAMHEAIQRFKMARLVPFENRAMRDLQPLGSSITQHLNRMIQAASNKFNAWQEHKKRNFH